MNKLLLDTNILIYAIDQESKFFTDARKVLESSDYHLLTTSKNLSELLTVITRSSGYDLNMKLGLAILEEILTGVSVIYPNHESLARFLELIGRYEPVGLHIYDFEIISIALANGIDHIATFNRDDFKQVKEITLFDFK